VTKRRFDLDRPILDARMTTRVHCIDVGIHAAQFRCQDEHNGLTGQGRRPLGHGLTLKQRGSADWQK